MIKKSGSVKNCGTSKKSLEFLNSPDDALLGHRDFFMMKELYSMLGERIREIRQIKVNQTEFSFSYILFRRTIALYTKRAFYVVSEVF